MKPSTQVEDFPLPRLTFFAPATLSLAVLALLLAACPAVASDDSQALERAIQAFEEGDYLAAQVELTAIDRAKLTREQQVLRDDYLGRVQVAMTLSEKALRDLEDAETAIAEREYARAEELLNRVIANEYAPQSLRRSARAHLRDVRERAALVRESGSTGSPGSTPPVEAAETPGDAHVPKAVQPPTASPGLDAVERARALTREGDDLVRAARYAEAENRYRAALSLVPGYPEAVDGLERARLHEENASGPAAESLAERIRRQDAINWQRTVSLYRDAENAIREYVASERMEEANQLLVRARQVVESGKQYADPITKYENLRSEVEALANYVRVEERAYHERKVAQTRREIEEQRDARLRQLEESRAQQVDALMQQALQHRKDGDLDAAINVLKQVVVIDPKHAPARWLMDILADQRSFRRSRENRDLYYEQSRGALQDVEEAKIPWYEEIKYPKDWLDIISRETRRKPGELRRDALLLGALDQPVPVDFRGVPFDQAIERLVDTHRLNIIVNWHDLERAGIERAVPVDLSLPSEITLKKALTEILEQAGGGVVEVGYEVADGAITIATQQFLDKKTFPAVYNITDLLMEIPQFTDAPMMDLRYAMQSSAMVSERADLPWIRGDDDDDEPEEDPERMNRVRKVMELIQDTVAPDSWRDRGGSIGTMREINGQLVVTQNSAAHRQIQPLVG